MCAGVYVRVCSVCDSVLARGKVSQIFARLIISAVSLSAAVRDTKEAACLPVPKVFSTSSLAAATRSSCLLADLWRDS